MKLLWKFIKNGIKKLEHQSSIDGSQAYGKQGSNQKIPGSLKFKYIAQNKIRPPTFNIYHNKNSKVPKVAKRYIINRIREKFGFEGIPIRINLMTSKNPFNKKK